MRKKYYWENGKKKLHGWDDVSWLIAIPIAIPFVAVLILALVLK